MPNPFYQKSHHGIYLYGMQNTTIGGSGTTPNSFQNLEVGIYAKRCSAVTVLKSNFNTINTVCPVANACTVATIKGWGIYGDENGEMTIGSASNSALGNTFSNSYNGINLTRNAKFGIYNNSFNNITTPPVQNGMLWLDWSTANCIFIENYNGLLPSNNYVKNNIFTNFENGIHYNANVALSLEVSQNQFGNFNSINATAVNILDIPTQNISINNNLINSSSQAGVNGIKVENISANYAAGQNLNIFKNTIRNIQNGIWVKNYNSPQIYDHNSLTTSFGTNNAGIYFPTSLTGTQAAPNVGIQINNCPNASIRNNYIERTNYTTTAPAPLAVNQYDYQFGISVGNSCTGTTVLDNRLKLLGTGIYAFGNTPITLKCNNMVNNATGLWINSLIGNQGTVSAPQDNTWTIPSGYMGVRRNGSQSPLFYTRALFNSSLPVTSSQFMPNPNNINQMSPLNAINPPNPQPVTISAPSTCFISAGNPPAGLVQVINEEGEYSYLSEEELKSLDVDLYKTLKIIPDFYDESTMEGQRIKEFVDSVELSNSAKIYEYEEKLEQKDTIGAKELMALFDAYSDVELNYKRVYEIYNRTWLNGLNSFSLEDSLVLNEIAYLSPRVAGNAVYTARVLLGLMIIDTETYAAKSAQLNTTNTNTNVKIYPNPSNDYFHYELPMNEEDKGMISIRDISGKVIQCWSADYVNKHGSFDIQNYAKGVYLFELIINGNQKFVEKLIVK